MLDVTLSCSDLDAFRRLDTLGLTVIGQHFGGREAVLTCRVREPEPAGPLVPGVRVRGSSARHRDATAGARC